MEDLRLLNYSQPIIRIKTANQRQPHVLRTCIVLEDKNIASNLLVNYVNVVGLWYNFLL